MGEPDADAGAGKKDFDKMLIAKTMSMLTEGDKALALATASAHRSLEREKRLWAQERKDWKMCCLQLDHAHEAYAQATSLPSSSCLIPSSRLSLVNRLFSSRHAGCAVQIRQPGSGT